MCSCPYASLNVCSLRVLHTLFYFLYQFSGTSPEEPVHLDPNSSKRKLLREDHQQKMSSLRRKWKAKKDQIALMRAQATLKYVVCESKRCDFVLRN